MSNRHETLRARKAREAEEARRHEAKRRTLKFIAGGTALAVLAGTGVAAALGAFDGEDKSGISRVTEEYPEIAGFTLREEVSIKTKLNSFDLYNFTELRLDQHAAQDLYSYIESIPLNGWNGTYNTPDGVTQWVSLPRKSAGTSVFIVPAEAPNPKWAKTDEEAGTFIPRDARRRILTRIRLTDTDKLDPPDLFLLNTVEKQVNLHLNIEACHAIIAVGTTIPTVNHQMQEIFANSIGRLLAMKQYNISYAQYKEYMDNYGHDFFGLPGRYIDLNQQDYNQVPSLKPVLS